MKRKRRPTRKPFKDGMTTIMRIRHEKIVMHDVTMRIKDKIFNRVGGQRIAGEISRLKRNMHRTIEGIYFREFADNG